MLGLQPIHLLAIVVVALMIFGPSRLPEIGKAVGKSIREFRDAASTMTESVSKGMEDKPEQKTETKTDA